MKILCPLVVLALLPLQTFGQVSSVEAPPAQARPTEKRQADRLAILHKERTSILADLKQYEGNQEVVTRLQRDLIALDKEIAIVSRQPAYPDSWNKQAAAQKPAVKPAAEAVNLQEPAPQSFDGWDVFHNFNKVR